VTLHSHASDLRLMAICLAVGALLHDPKLLAIGATTAFLGYVTFSFLDCIAGFIYRDGGKIV